MTIKNTLIYQVLQHHVGVNMIFTRKYQNSHNSYFSAILKFYILLVLIVNLLIRTIFAIYGYIATEEGTLLLNQQFAYQGQLPFVHYDAWSSLIHDYLLGWHQLLFPDSILFQRFVGIVLSAIVFWACLKIAKSLHSSAPFYTAIFLTFGSWWYLYLSTIPYSEQFMTLFLILAISHHKSPKLSLVFATLATLVRSQALPATLLFFIYSLKKSPRLWYIPLLVTAVILLPWLIKDPSSIFWAFFWPLQASKILMYQSDFSQVTISQLINFSLEVIRDYGLITAIAMAGIVTKTFTKQKKFMWLLSAIILTQIVIGLIHQPPYASYISPIFPLIAIVAATAWAKHATKFSNIMLIGLLIFNIAVFPHAQFMKTSLSTIAQTPHTHLKAIGAYVNSVTRSSDQIISFYTPIALAAQRELIPDFSRGPFSVSNLPDASSHHLITTEKLRQLITSQTPAAVIITNKTSRVFKDIDLLDQYYYSSRTFTEIRFLEDPKTTELTVYLRRP